MLFYNYPGDQTLPKRHVETGNQGLSCSHSLRPIGLPLGSVSKVEMVTPMALINKVLFPSISTFETLPSICTTNFWRSPSRGRSSQCGLRPGSAAPRVDGVVQGWKV